MADSDVQTLLMKLAEALHRYDTPAHRLEETLGHVSEKLGADARFFSTPTSVFASLVENGDTKTALLRTASGDINLGKLAAVDMVIMKLLRDKITIQQAIGEVDAIMEEPRRYPTWLSMLAFVVVSACAARFFGGGIREILATAAIGLWLSILSTTLPRLHHSGQFLFQPVAAFSATIAACFMAHFIGHVSIYVTTVGSLIILIPGLTFTVAMNELATRHLVSGTARFAAAMSTFVGIGFGVALGMRLATTVLGELTYADPIALPDWTLWLSLAISPLGISVLFQSMPRDFIWAVVAGVLAFTGARWGAAMIGPELGTFVAAGVLGIFSNLYARILDRAASTVMVPGFLLLVPGSIGFSSVFSLISNDFATGLENAYAMSLVAVALVSGLLMANALLPPRRDL